MLCFIKADSLTHLDATCINWEEEVRAIYLRAEVHIQGKSDLPAPVWSSISVQLFLAELGTSTAGRSEGTFWGLDAWARMEEWTYILVFDLELW